MIPASPEIVALVMVVALLGALSLGLPIAFAMGGCAMLITVLFWGHAGFCIVQTSVYAVMSSIGLVAIPLFIFMSIVLEGSGVADQLFHCVRLFTGRIPGGLALAVILVCTIIAAMVGTSSAGVITMGLLALPIMLKIGYDKNMALGPILAGGALGFLIPPSGAFIMYGTFVEVSIGRLFAGGMIPGLVLSLMYMIYVAIRCLFQSHLGPPLPSEERITWREKIVSTKGLILPVFLIIIVLGSIFAGIASPTESASLGAAGSLICAAVNRKVSWPLVKKAMIQTFTISATLMWILIGAFTFKAVLVATGGIVLARDFILGLSLSREVILWGILFSWLILGMFMDEIAYMMLTFPVYLPIITGFGFDLVWFGVIWLVTAQIACLTPPFGFALFVMKSIAPRGISLADIWRSVWPFVVIQLVGLYLVVYYPPLSLWLPNLLFGR